MENIINNNKLIAEFMGLEICFGDTTEPCVLSTQEIGVWKPMKYHSSWDWLMPVVEKIQQIDENNFCVTIDENVCHIWSENNVYDIETVSHTTLEAVYNSIVEFINWYNKNID